MVTPVRKLTLLTAVFSLNFALFCAQLNSFLDLEEIDDVKYGIDIADTPVLVGRPLQLNVVYMKSKHGQEYECQLPEDAVDKHHDEDKETAEIGIPELLKPLENLPCLIKTKQWWTYEFCYGRDIKQYHMEDGNAIGDIISLGHFDSEFDWKNHSHKEMKKHKANRYHSQLYKNGSVCDLTGKMRETEVRFLCSEEESDILTRVDEPSSCTYLLTIYTNRVCKHPYLRLPPSYKPRPILCFPALNHDQYEKYLERKNDEEQEREMRMKAIEEVLAKHQAEAEERAQELAASSPEVSVQESHDIIVSKSDLLKTISSKMESVFNTMVIFGKDFLMRKEAKPAEKVRQKTVESLFDLAYDLDGLAKEFHSSETHPQLNQLGDKLTESADELHALAVNIKENKDEENLAKQESYNKLSDLYKDIINLHASLTKSSGEDTTDGRLTEIEVDVELDVDLQNEEQMETLLSHLQTTIQNVGSSLINTDTSQEARASQSTEDSHSQENRDSVEEDSMEDGDIGEQLLTEAELEEFDLETKLKILEDELDDMYDDTDNKERIVDHIKNNILQQFDDILAEAQEEFGDDKIFDEIDHRDAAKNLAKMLNKVVDTLKTRMEDKLEEEKKASIKQTSTKTDELKAGAHDDLDDLEDDEEEDEPELDVDEEEDHDDRVRVRVTKINIAGEITKEIESEIYDSKYKKIEKAVEEHLESAGINPDGKIDVKIIAYDPHEDESGVTILSEEESSYFKNMIVGLLGGGRESSQEEQRQQRLEENYNLVWSDSDSRYQQPTDDRE